MSLTDAQKVDYVFKKVKSLGRTSSSKAYYSESEPGGILIDNSAVMMDSVPSTPPATTTSIVKCYIPSPGDGRLLLTVDGTVASSKAWKATVGGIIQKNWIPPYYATAYAARIFKSDNSTEIPTTDVSDWIFDYESGVLTFDGTCPDVGGIYLHAYKYVGKLGVTRTACITYVIDGGGSEITDGIKGDLEVPFACTITQCELLANQTGSIVVDIWKDVYNNFPPTVDDTIIGGGGTKPTISTSTKSKDTTLTNWTTVITAGDILRFNVDSCTDIQRATLSLQVTKT